MKKSKSLFEAINALKSVTQDLFKKMPVLFLVLIYLIDLGVRAYLSEGWSITYLVGLLILFISIGLYVSTKSFAETTLSFICKQSSKVHTFSPANAHFFSASFLAGNGLVVS